MQYSRSSPTRAMEAIRHEHECGRLEVKRTAVWILNVLVDATRHHGKTETVDQNSGLVDLHSKKGKGRAANRLVRGGVPPAALCKAAIVETPSGRADTLSLGLARERSPACRLGWLRLTAVRDLLWGCMTPRYRDAASCGPRSCAAKRS